MINQSQQNYDEAQLGSNLPQADSRHHNKW